MWNFTPFWLQQSLRWWVMAWVHGCTDGDGTQNGLWGCIFPAGAGAGADCSQGFAPSQEAEQGQNSWV